jgi:hypothetical protein
MKIFRFNCAAILEECKDKNEKTPYTFDLKPTYMSIIDSKGNSICGVGGENPNGDYIQ